MKSLRYLPYCFVFILLSGASIMAQPPDPQADPDDNVVPITGIEWLLVAGGAMGGYKLFKKKNTEDSTDEH